MTKRMSGEPAGATGSASLDLLGLRLNPLSCDQLNMLVESSVESRERRIFAHHNLHSLYLFHHDSKLREFYRQAFIAHIDGMSLVLLARIFGLAVFRAHRVTYVDWIRPLINLASINGWRVFYLGSKPGVAVKAASSLKEDFPGLSIKVQHGYFDTALGCPENVAVIRQIADYKPHLLFVGMGMPRQEQWVLENLEQLTASVVLTSGACFDYIAGDIPTPPRWMGRVGLEWLFRLCSEPRRLWKRYLLEPIFVLGLLLKGMYSQREKESH